MAEIYKTDTHIGVKSARKDAVPNHLINIQTGFLENPAYAYDFDSNRKIQFLETFYANNGKMYKTLDQIGLKKETVNKALNNDPLFKQKFDEVWERLRDDAQGVLTQNALRQDDPRFQASNIFWLKKNIPHKYGDDLKIQNNSVVINVDSHTLSEYAKKVSEIQQEISTEEIEIIDVKHEKMDSVDSQQD